MATAINESLEKLVYERPVALADRKMHYCPGCTHGTAHTVWFSPKSASTRARIRPRFIGSTLSVTTPLYLPKKDSLACPDCMSALQVSRNQSLPASTGMILAAGVPTTALLQTNAKTVP